MHAGSNDQQPLIDLHSHGDPNDKVRRKRVLLSSDFRTAYSSKKTVYDAYVELNQF